MSDGKAKSDRMASVIQTVIDYHSPRSPGSTNAPYTIQFFNYDKPLSEQMRTYSEQITVLFSAMSCDLVKKISSEAISLRIMHFALNLRRCTGLQNDSHLVLDRVPGSDIVKAVVDIIQNRTDGFDILVLHDANYEQKETLYSLLVELSSRNIRYTYVPIQDNVARLARRVSTLIRGAMELSTVVFADLKVFKLLLHKMYEQNVLDPRVSYMVVNDGWESRNPDIERPSSIDYELDILMLLLRRNVPRSLVELLEGVTDVIYRKSPELLREASVPSLVREDMFITAAVSSCMTAARNLAEQPSTDRCPISNQTQVFSGSFSSIVLEKLRSDGATSDSASYELLRNFPVTTKSEIFKPIAVWRSNSTPHLLQIRSETDELFKNRTLKLAIPFIPPYTVFEGNDTAEISSGALNHVFEYMARYLHFSYELLSADDNEWGSRRPDGRWSGTVGMLLSRTVDLVPFLGITRGRSEVLDFSEPVMTTASAILVRKPREPPRAFIFLRPFSRAAWISIIMSVPVMGYTIYVVNRKSHRFSGKKMKNSKKNGMLKLGYCMWYCYGSILQQGGRYLPECTSARILVSFWWMFVMVVMAMYSGTLIAYLTFPEVDWKVSSLEGLAKDTATAIYMKGGSSLHAEITHNVTTEVLRLLKERFEEGVNVFLIDDHTSVLPEIINGDAALIDDVYVIYDIINRAYSETGRCDLAVVPEIFLEIYVGIAGRRGSPYLKDISKLMRSLWNGGMTQYWAANFSQLSYECNYVVTKLHSDRKDVTLNDLQGAFYLLFLGLIASALVVSTEVICRKRKKLSSIRCHPVNASMKRSKKLNDMNRFHQIAIIGDHKRRKRRRRKEG